MKLYFKDVIPYLNDMFTGLGYSVLLTVISMALGMVVGIAAYLIFWPSGNRSGLITLNGFCYCHGN